MGKSAKTEKTTIRAQARQFLNGEMVHGIVWPDMQDKKLLLAIAVFFSTLCIFSLTASSVSALAAPTILRPAQKYVVPPDTELVVSGLAPSRSTVYLFVDGKLKKGAKVKRSTTASATFVFRLSTGIYNAGSHAVRLQAILGKDKSPYTDEKTFTIPATWPRRIDGVVVPANSANAVPTAVMIENLSTVRPQAGLSAASLVYETLAEGGIPRFIAFFARQDMRKVGPVRSARPYFVDWAKEIQAPLMHAGGSRDAFNEFGRLGVRSIDALLGRTSRYFFRSGPVLSTHTLFTSGSRMERMRNERSVAEKAPYRAWRFKNDAALAKRPNERRRLEIDFGYGKANVVAYYYNRQTNVYYRFNGGKQHTDANDKSRLTIRAKNVVVQLIPREKVLDRKGRLQLNIVGRGKGWIAQDGKLVPLTWQKSSASTRTIFRHLNGKEAAFNRGPTWVEVVPTNPRHRVVFQ